MEPLSACEEEVLMTVYQMEETPTMMDVLVDVNRRFQHEWKPQTVSTFLSRCVKKGYLEMRREGRYAYYEPVIEIDVYRKMQVEKLKNILFGGDTKLMIEYLEEEDG